MQRKSPAGAGLFRGDAAYFVVVVVVSDFVAVPAGVSTLVVDVDEVSDVEGLVASTVTLVDDEDGGATGCTTIVEELAGGVLEAGCSFTTVVEEVVPGRSHPATAAPRASTAMTGISCFIGCLH